MAALAAQQHGVVASRQLAAIGILANAVTIRVDRGRLHRIHRGVFAVGHAACTDRGYALAAVLACGPGAALSHRDAAALWQLIDVKRPGAIDVTVASRSRAGRAGICVHRTRRLHPDEVTTLDGIPVTTVARTLIDLTDCCGRDRQARAVREADYLRLLDLDAVDAALQRAQGRRRLHVLRDVLAHHRPGTVVRSELEHRFLELCREAGLPQPECNVPLQIDGQRYVVDCLWREQRVVVELDGAAAHATQRTFEADRTRDAALTASGFKPLRFTWQALDRRPQQVFSVLGSTLEMRSPSGPWSARAGSRVG